MPVKKGCFRKPLQELLVYLSSEWLLYTNVWKSTVFSRSLRYLGGWFPWPCHWSPSNPSQGAARCWCKDMLNPCKNVSWAANLGRPWCARQYLCGFHVVSPSATITRRFLLFFAMSMWWYLFLVHTWWEKDVEPTLTTDTGAVRAWIHILMFSRTWCFISWKARWWYPVLWWHKAYTSQILFQVQCLFGFPTQQHVLGETL